MRVLVVTPTYLEAENIEEFLERLRAAAPDCDVLVVDDNSADGTADLAEKAGAELGRIDVLRRPEKIGLGDAYRAGFAVGMDRGYELLVQIDADLSHDPRALPGLIEAVEDGADLAIGSRYVPGGSIPHWPWLRRGLSKWGNRYTNFVLGMPINDATVGVPGVPRRRVAQDRLFEHAREGLRLPDRARVPSLAVRRPDRPASDRVHRSRARGVQDDLAGRS